MRLLITTLIIVLILPGCELGQFTQTKQLKDIFISFTVQPEHVTTATVAEFYATLRKDRQGVTGCKVQGRQYLPELKKTNEEKPFDFPEGGLSGVYHVRSQPFPVGGNWKIDITIVCAEDTYQVDFPLTVAEQQF